MASDICKESAIRLNMMTNPNRNSSVSDIRKRKRDAIPKAMERIMLEPLIPIPKTKPADADKNNKKRTDSNEKDTF